MLIDDNEVSMKDDFLWAVGWLIAFIDLFLLAPLYTIVIIGDSIRGIDR